ncbi:putative amidoligase enzyme-domain-containing protein [Halenospora varia]|nr:putative amidoligase enzyme-domain-containing protein [Halenospora varia]
MTNQHSSARPPNLTFGLEIEFALATTFFDRGDPHQQDSRQASGIHDELAPLPRINTNGNASICNRIEKKAIKHIVATLRSVGVRARSPKDSLEIDAWYITTDSTIEDPTGGDYAWAAIEINSPPLYFSNSGIDQVQTVCRILTSRYRINCNESCGLHIHVGRERKNFDAVPLRNLMALLWSFEGQLDMIHPLHRVDGDFCANFAGCTLGYQLGILGEDDSREKWKQGLDEILRTKSRKDLLDLFSGGCRGHRLSYYLGNLIDYKDPGADACQKKTVEYRQHEATLDPIRIGHWIRTCIGLVEFAHTVDTPVLKAFLYARIEDDLSDFSVVNVLKAVGLPVQARYYGLRLLKEKLERERLEEKEQEPSDTKLDPSSSEEEYHPIPRVPNANEIIAQNQQRRFELWDSDTSEASSEFMEISLGNSASTTRRE